MRLDWILLVVVTCNSAPRTFSVPTNSKTTWNFYNRSNNAALFNVRSSQTDRQSGQLCFFQACDQRSHKRPRMEEVDENPTRLTNMFESLDTTTKAFQLELTGALDEDRPPSVPDAKHVNETQSRIVPFIIKAEKSGRDKYPMIQLGQIVRKLIFPNWIWQGGSGLGGLSKKVGPSAGVANGNLSKSESTGIPISFFKLPSITFDNNYSRFFKLFTMVKFNNTPCIGSTGFAGICYHSTECATFGGTGTSPCAGGLGVCCIFSYTCGGVSGQNGTYFVDGAGALPVTGTCVMEIIKINPLVKQIRLDFEVFSLQQPKAGNCELDRFVVSGQNVNNDIPTLCGDNNGTHIYVETSGSGSIRLSVTTRGVGFRTWRIRITQIDMTSASISPYCLQQEIGTTGTVNSFNYNSPTTPQYLNTLNYAICFVKSTGFCSITFTNGGLDGPYRPFQIVNANENGALVIPSGQAGIGVRDCPYDYILINGNRLCGDKLNDGLSNGFLILDVPVTDFSNGPFIVTVRTNELDVGGGFFLYYKQNPC